MYEEIGKKIKILARIIFVLGFIGSLIFSIIYIKNGTNNASDMEIAFKGILVFLIGVILAWVSTFVLYGFGELVDKVCDIADDVSGIKYNTKNKDGGLDKIKSIKFDEWEK